MPTIVVRYKTKSERGDENQQLVEKVFAELDEMDATGFAYASFQAGRWRVIRPPRGRGGRRGVHFAG